MTGLLKKDFHALLKKSGHRQEHRRTTCEDGRKNWGKASTSQEVSKTVSKPPEAGRDMEQILLHISQQESTLDQHLDRGLLASKIVIQYISVC